MTVLFPSALENAYHGRECRQDQGQDRGRACQRPDDPEADQILFKNGVYVIPDFLCNAGGVTVSYFEQVQNAYNYYWTIEDVHARLDAKMTNAFTLSTRWRRRTTCTTAWRPTWSPSSAWPMRLRLAGMGEVGP